VGLAQTPLRTEDAKLTPSDGATSNSFGSSVAIDANVAVIGSHGDDDGGTNAGAAYVFRFDGVFWNEEAKLVASDAGDFDALGSSVSIRRDVVLVGAPGSTNGKGAAYVFRFDGTSWTEESKLTASDAASNDRFGTSVSLHGDVAVAGSPFDDNGRGAAYVFRFGSASWVEQQKLTAADAAVGDNFGFSVSISGDALVAGARLDDDRGLNSGSAYVFWFDGAAWIEEAKLTASDAFGGDNFGFSVSIDGDAMIIGSLHDDEAGWSSGSAYIFRFDGFAWTEETKVTASDAAPGDQFGTSVSMCRDLAVVGSRLDDDAGSGSGSAYVFSFDGASWTEETKLLSSDGASEDSLGGAVAACGTAVITAIGDDVNGPFSGSAYVFVLITNAPPEAVCMVELLSNIGAEALVLLDGSGSSDPDHNCGCLTFEWTVDGDLVCVGPNCAIIEVPLAYGTHEITLRVTDPAGAFDEVTKLVTIDPAALSLLAADKVWVEFKHDRIKLTGEVAMPFGVDFSQEIPFALARIDVAGQPILAEPTVPVLFEAAAGHFEKWSFDEKAAALGIRRFDIDWEGARFQLKEHGFPVELKSQVISTTQTVLTVKYKLKDLAGPFTMQIDGQATAQFETDGTVTANVGVDVEKAGREVTLTLPFPLQETSEIVLSGAVDRSLAVTDHLEASVGRFRLEATFAGQLFPDAEATTPRTLDLYLFVGAAGYPGEVRLGPADLEPKRDRWNESKGH
jgi:hypothetical protein